MDCKPKVVPAVQLVSDLQLLVVEPHKHQSTRVIMEVLRSHTDRNANTFLRMCVV